MSVSLQEDLAKNKTMLGIFALVFFLLIAAPAVKGLKLAVCAARFTNKRSTSALFSP